MFPNWAQAKCGLIFIDGSQFRIVLGWAAADRSNDERHSRVGFALAVDPLQ